MKPNKTPPASPTAAPTRVATTLTSGSLKGKTTGSGQTGQTKPGVTEDQPMGPPSPAVVHDFLGVALLMLPAGLRPVLGPKHLLSNALELETQEILVIVREAGTVAYLHLPILVMEMEQPGASVGQGMVLHDITGSLARASAAKGRHSTATPTTKAKATTKTAKPVKPRAPVKPMHSQETPPKRTVRRSYGK